MYHFIVTRVRVIESSRLTRYILYVTFSNIAFVARRVGRKLYNIFYDSLSESNLCLCKTNFRKKKKKMIIYTRILCLSLLNLSQNIERKNVT